MPQHDDKEFTMKRSLQYKRPFAGLRPTVLVLALMAGGAVNAWAQASGDISDADRAKRDANKVFNFIKFHAVKPAAAPAPAPAPKPTPKPAPRPDTSTVAAAPAPAATALAPTASAPTATAPAASPTALAALEPRTLPPTSEPALAPTPVAAEPAAAPTPTPAPAAEEEDDPGIKLVKYVAPELNARAMAAMPGSFAKVRVRFTVMPDGSAGKVHAVSNSPRPLAQVAVRAVEQWRFEGVKEPQEVEVEVDFKLDE